MDSRTGMATIALAALLVLAGCSTAIGATAEPQENGTEPDGMTEPDGTTLAAATGTTISVSATGRVTAEPDEARISLAVTADGDTAEAVREQLASDGKALRQALADAGVSDDEIETTSFAVRERSPSDDRSERTDYYGRHTFLVTLSDLDLVGTVIGAATEHADSSVDGVWFTLSEARQAELRADALAKAVESARSDADALAAAADLDVTGVASISTSNGPVYPVMFDGRAVAEGGADGTPTKIDSGPVTVSASVSIVYDADASSDG